MLKVNSQKVYYLPWIFTPLQSFWWLLTWGYLHGFCFLVLYLFLSGLATNSTIFKAIKLQDLTFYKSLFNSIDHSIPFLPKTIFLYYLSYLVIFLFPCLFFIPKFFSKFQQHFIFQKINQFLYSLFITEIIFSLLWLIPIIYDHNQMQRYKSLGNNIIKFLFEWTSDTGFLGFKDPLNLGAAIPSIHASPFILFTCFLWSCRKLRKDYLFTWFAWISGIIALLIIISTVTTKRHYFIDPLLGLVFNLLIWKIITEWIRFFPIHNYIFYKK
jgi:hypothetical protein